MGADPVAYAVAAASHGTDLQIDAFSVRKEAKAHGMGRQIEGNFRAGDEVVVVEDVITTGGSAERAISAVEAAGESCWACWRSWIARKVEGKPWRGRGERSWPWPRRVSSV